MYYVPCPRRYRDRAPQLAMLQQISARHIGSQTMVLCTCTYRLGTHRSNYSRGLTCMAQLEEAKVAAVEWVEVAIVAATC